MNTKELVTINELAKILGEEYYAVYKVFHDKLKDRDCTVQLGNRNYFISLKKLKEISEGFKDWVEGHLAPEDLISVSELSKKTNIPAYTIRRRIHNKDYPIVIKPLIEKQYINKPVLLSKYPDFEPLLG